MRPNRLKRLWQDGKPALGGWLTVPSSVSAEAFAHAGFDWVCIDTQHGLIDYQVAVTMLQAISTTDAVPVVRVQWNDPGIIMKTLDAGAYGVIIPMVNTRAEAEAAAGACRYAPRGYRSYGPGRAVYYAGRDYFPNADDEVCCIPMIETKEALENLEEIMSVPGIDAVYIGPSDLSVSLGLPPAYDHDEALFTDAIDRVLDGCRRHGIVPGVHAGNPPTARKRIEQGFQMIEICDDGGSLARSAAAALRDVRGEGEEGAAPAV
jgi:4-hydroxy-2-oxoheptanedioate aldolase